MCERLICYPWKYPVYLLDLVSWLVTQKDMLCKQKCKTPSLPINLLNLVGQSLVKPIILQTKWYQCKLGTLLTLCKLLWNRSFIFSRKTQVSSSLSDGKMVFYVLAIKPWVVLCTLFTNGMFERTHSVKEISNLCLLGKSHHAREK